jgi:hypothetical protein
MRVLFSFALIVLAAICAALSVKPLSSSATGTRFEARGVPIYGIVHVVVPPDIKMIPEGLIAEP